MPVIMMNFTSQSCCVEHFIGTYRAVKYVDGSHLVN